MKLHITILLSAIIVAVGLVLSSRPPVHDRYFADDLLPAKKTVSRAEVIDAANKQIDHTKLFAGLEAAGYHAKDFRVVDAKASLDQKALMLYGDVTLQDGTHSPLNFGCGRDEFGAWTGQVYGQSYTLSL